MAEESLVIEGRNAVIEAFRSGKTIDKVFVLDGCQDGPIRTIVRESKKTRYNFAVCGKRKIRPVIRNRQASGSCCSCGSI